MSRDEETVSGPDKAALDTVLNYLKTRNLKVSFGGTSVLEKLCNNKLVCVHKISARNIM